MPLVTPRHSGGRRNTKRTLSRKNFPKKKKNKNRKR